MPQHNISKFEICAAAEEKMHCIDEKLMEPLLSKLFGRGQQHIERSEENAKFIRRIRHYHSAPEMDDICPKEKPKRPVVKPNFQKHDSHSMILTPALVFSVYLGVGLVSFSGMKNELEGEKTNSVIDALYFCVVTMTTVGYGDLTPSSMPAKLFTCGFVFVGFGLMGFLLGSAADFLVDKQEKMLVKALSGTRNSDYEATGGLYQVKTVRWKVAIAGVVVLFLLTIGIIFLMKVEDMTFLEAFYCVCVTVTTLGYGDMSFDTTLGRSFAAVWILVSTISVAQFFLYSAELYTEGRRQSLLHWVLTRKTTSSDLEAADMDNDGVVSAAEFVLYKLNEMGKVDQEDVAQILKEFDILDVDNSGTLSPYDLRLGQTAEA